MFCYKCGTEIAEGAAFCPNCGEKIKGNTEQQVAASTTAMPMQQPNVVPEDTLKRKKSKKMPIFLGITALVIGVAIIISKIWYGKTDYVAGVLGTQKAVNLSETYTNKAEGISFRYPSKWKVVENLNPMNEIADGFDYDGLDMEIIVILANESVISNSNIGIFKIPDIPKEEIESLFISDDEFVSINEVVFNGSIEETSVVELDGIPARMMTGVDQTGIVSFRLYAYVNGTDMYSVMFACRQSQTKSFDRFFDAIIDSYTITAVDTLDENMGGNNVGEVLSENIRSGEISYDGIPLSVLISASASEMIADLGTPILYDEYMLVYDDIEFDLNGETITRTESYSLEKYTVDGENLEKNRAGLVEILGEPSDEGYVGGGYSMTYYFPTYSVYFELDEVDSEAWRICVLPLDDEQSAYSFDDLSDFSYNELYLYGGSYEADNATSIGVSIYSSFDEGSTVGNIRIYDSFGYEMFAEIRDDNEGDGIYTLCFDDVDAFIQFYQNSAGTYCADILGLDAVYTNADLVETYIMTEQYIP